MMTLFFDPALSAALSIAVKASALLGLAAIVQLAISRKASAALRHLVWTLAMASVVLLPLLWLALPEWTVVISTTTTSAARDLSRVESSVERFTAARPSSVTAASTEAVHGVEQNVSSPIDTGAEARSFWIRAIVGTYAAGVFVMLIHLAVQRWRVHRLAQEAGELRDGKWTSLLSECAARLRLRRSVRLLRSCEHSMPMALGTRRPAILIPATGDTWPEDRRQAVLLHELAHVARRDCLTQMLAHVACTMYWFHPGAWWVARRMRTERELACDDRVIAAGARASDYAGHLLEIAYSLGSYRAPALAVSMARRRQLESRLRSVLDVGRNRNVPALAVRAAAALIAAALVLPLAGASLRTVAAEASSVGDVRQPAQLAAPELKSWDSLFRESAARLIRAAAGALGLAQDGLPGTWEIRPTKIDGTVHLRLTELNSSSGTNVPIDQLQGLSGAQLTGPGGPAQFQLRRDAGTFKFEGVLRSGVGAGTFSFAPDPNFPVELAKRGFTRPTAAEQYQMARHDVGLAFVDELNKQGYAKPETSELVRAGQHGVQLTYLREMGALGYRLGSLAPLIELRDHGVTPDYVRELADQGYKGLAADELRRARDHGISPDYVRGMRDAGHGSLAMDQLINARDHGVTPDYVRELGEAGYRKLPLDQAIRVRDHGVTPDYAREMRQLGHDVALDDLVRARDHGIDVPFAREMAALGYGSLPLDSLVRARDHGVTPTYVQDLKTLGYDRLAIEDVVMLRDHGLTTDRIRQANAKAGTRLSIDMLKAVAAGGMR